MKTSIAVLALLVCATWAAPSHNGQGEGTTEIVHSESQHPPEHHAPENTKVAFSVGSGYQGTHGPFNTEVNLVFTKVLVNVGNAYSLHTGIFKAPVKGVYHVSVSAFGNTNTWLELYLIKNGQHVFGLSESPKGSNMSMSKSVILLLEQGDELYLRLKDGCQMYDDGQTYNIFSGFLLFPM